MSAVRAASVIPLFAELRAPAERPEQAPSWGLGELVGRLSEVSGIGALSAAMGVVLDAQQQGEPVAWVSAGGALFYPPDVAESGIDLSALAVVRVVGAEAAARAADKLLRSGGFGLVVLDLMGGAQGAPRRGFSRGSAARGEVPMALQARLVKVAQHHSAAVLALTDKSPQVASLSSLVSLRCDAGRRWLDSDRYRCEIRVLKDKRRGPVWQAAEILRAPAGIGEPVGRAG